MKRFFKIKTQKYIVENKLTKNVKLMNLLKILYPDKQADLFILSSKYEGLPNVLLEALVLKKFIISSDCPTGPREILMNGKGGLLFKTNDHRDLSKNYYFIKNKKKW